jgi:hypothetical protein
VTWSVVKSGFADGTRHSGGGHCAIPKVVVSSNKVRDRHLQGTNTLKGVSRQNVDAHKTEPEVAALVFVKSYKITH